MAIGRWARKVDFEGGVWDLIIICELSVFWSSIDGGDGFIRFEMECLINCLSIWNFTLF